MRSQLVGIAIVFILFVSGTEKQLQMGRENLAFDFRKAETFNYIDAAWWIESHTASNDVVMARKKDVVYHYCKRKVIWFPPISNVQILMEGIQKYKVTWIVVGDGTYSYWLPTEDRCFDRLAYTYPESFELAHIGHRYKIYKVLARPSCNPTGLRVEHPASERPA